MGDLGKRSCVVLAREDLKSAFLRFHLLPVHCAYAWAYYDELA